MVEPIVVDVVRVVQNEGHHTKKMDEKSKKGRGNKKPNKSQGFSLGHTSLSLLFFLMVLAILSLNQFDQDAPLELVEANIVNETMKLPLSRPKAPLKPQHADISPIAKDGFVEVTFTTKDGSCRVAHLPRDRKFLKIDSNGPKLSIDDLMSEGQVPTKMALPKNMRSYPCESPGESRMQ